MITDKETAIFREKIDPNFPDLIELARKCPLVMVNSNELYDFPRPTLAKIVNIGGVGAQLKDVEPLSHEFQQIVDVAKGIVVFSFGSVAPSDRMPFAWKMAFIDAFKRFPDYHFIWRYVGTVSAGVPLITIPLFGDQPKNSKLAEQHHFALRIHKSEINADTVAEVLKKILTDQSYSHNIKRLAQMVRKKPESVSHLLVSWTEFVAEFKTLDNLVPAGNKLNFIQYHSIDVISLLLCIIFTICFILWKSLKFALLKLLPMTFSSRKQKNE
ncbi:unnamed protein product [Strongylus vulgaris]|uniref:glucuronosyltransferase n=1 Tax=Strongylus vulgaris TaxID=40348 RepID=A0A3P7JS73_STRVU|nr:unnamed protein product [Strongylus vulgaris]